MHQGSQEKERVAFDPTGNSPGTNQGENLEPRPLRDAAAQTKLGIPEAVSLGSPHLPAAHHYLHEDPKEQGSHPDLDGQLPHGAARVAPAAATGAVRGSHGSAGAASQSLGCKGGALQAAGGGGRRARGGGGEKGSAPISRSGLPDTQTGRFRSHSRSRRSGTLRGLPAPLSRVQFPCPGLAPRTRDPRREAWGSPRCSRRGLPEHAAWLPSYWAAPGLCARLHALPAAAARLLSSPRLLLSLSAPSTHARTWA